MITKQQLVKHILHGELPLSILPQNNQNSKLLLWHVTDSHGLTQLQTTSKENHICGLTRLSQSVFNGFYTKGTILVKLVANKVFESDCDLNSRPLVDGTRALALFQDRHTMYIGSKIQDIAVSSLLTHMNLAMDKYELIGNVAPRNDWDEDEPADIEISDEAASLVIERVANCMDFQTEFNKFQAKEQSHNEIIFNQWEIQGFYLIKQEDTNVDEVPYLGMLNYKQAKQLVN